MAQSPSKPLGHGLVFQPPPGTTKTELSKIAEAMQAADGLVKIVELKQRTLTREDAFGLLAAGIIVLRSCNVPALEVSEFVRLLASTLQPAPPLTLVVDNDEP